MILDSHAHLDMPEFNKDRTDVISKATEAGVGAIISIGIDAGSTLKAVKLAEDYSIIRAAAGLHPNMLKSSNEDDFTQISRLAEHPLVVAIGETGFDYYRHYSDKEAQKRAFMWHLELSYKLNKPFVIHCRQAEDDLLAILFDWVFDKSKEIKGVIHCFNGSLKIAQTYLKLGFHLSLGGYITYPSARDMANIIRKLPLDRLLVETDCPFLPPQKYRSQRNEPSYITHTVNKLAEIKGLPVDEVARITADNTSRLFNLSKIN